MSLSNLIVKCLLSCFMVEHDFQCSSIEDSFMREELHVQLYKIFLKRKFFQLNSFSCKIWVKKCAKVYNVFFSFTDDSYITFGTIGLQTLARRPLGKQQTVKKEMGIVIQIISTELQDELPHLSFLRYLSWRAAPLRY